MTASELAKTLREKFDGLFSDPVEFRGEITLSLLQPDRIVDVCRFAKESLHFNFLLDITSIDNYGDDPRWTLVYELYGLDHQGHLRLKIHQGEECSEVPSITGVWRTADWHEREIFDMMGIRFAGHPDLRRILMWDGYPFHPLRKDFPLAGKPSEMPDIAFSRKAPLEGGPFVTSSGPKDATAREPRSRTVDD